MRVMMGLAFLGAWASGALQDETALASAIVTAALYPFGCSGAGRARLLQLALCSIFLSLLAGDLALRLVLGESIYTRADEALYMRSPKLGMAWRYAPERRIEGRSSGDLAALSGSSEVLVWRTQDFETDRFGFRNRPAAADAPIEIVVAGDSFGLGSGTAQDLIWPSLLGRSLGRSIYNLSLGGQSPSDELYNLRFELPRLRLAPRALVIWMIFSGNDLEDSYATLGVDPLTQRRSIPGELYTRLANFRGHSPVFRLARSITSYPERKERVFSREIEGAGRMLFLHDYAAELERDYTGENFGKLLQSITDMKKLLAGRADLLIAIAPSKEEIYLRPGVLSSPLFEIIVPHCELLGISCVDLRSPLARAAPEAKEPLWWPDDTHWSESGHRVVSEFLSREVAAARAE